MPEITVICTFYDAVDYLPLTVKSVLNSTFTDFELLLVDDGGPNNCGKICDVLAETDSRIRVIHKPNGGPASALNVGIKNARGRYITMIDSDDLMAPNKLEYLYNAIQTSGCPMAACGADCIDSEGNPILNTRDEVTCSLTGKIDALEVFRDAFSYGSFYGPLCWNKLFDIELWRRKNILLDENMAYGDDASVLHKLFEGETMFCSNERLHHYRTRAGSLTASFRPRMLDTLIMYYDWVNYFSAMPKYSEIYQLSLARYWQVYYSMYHRAAQAKMLSEVQAVFARHLVNLRKLEPAILACPNVSDFEKFRLRLFCINPALTYNLACVWGKLHGEG